MFIFVCLTNILLVTSLISLLSNTLTRVGLGIKRLFAASLSKIDWLTILGPRFSYMHVTNTYSCKSLARRYGPYAWGSD